MKVLLISSCLDDNQRPDSMAIPHLTLSLIAGLMAEVFRNNKDMPVDFDVTKYVKPVKKRVLV